MIMNRLDPRSRQDDLEAFSAIVRSLQAKGHDRDSQKFLSEAAKFYAVPGERVKAELRLHSRERRVNISSQKGVHLARLPSNPLANRALALANYVKQKVESLPKQPEAPVIDTDSKGEKESKVDESKPSTFLSAKTDVKVATAVKLIESKAFREKANYITLASGATVALARRRPDVTSQMPKPNILNQKEVKLKRGFINELIPAVPVAVKSDTDSLESSTGDNSLKPNIANQVRKVSLNHQSSHTNLKRPIEATNNNTEISDPNLTRKSLNFVNKSNTNNSCINQTESADDRPISSKRARIDAININHATDAVFHMQSIPVSSTPQPLTYSISRNPPVQSRLPISVNNVTWGVSGATVRKDISVISHSNPPARHNSDDDDSEPEFDTSRFSNSSNRKRTVTVGGSCKNPTGSSSFQIALHPVPYAPSNTPPQNPEHVGSTPFTDQQGQHSNKVLPAAAVQKSTTKVIVGAPQYGSCSVEYVQGQPVNSGSSDRYYVSSASGGNNSDSVSLSFSSPRLLPPTSAPCATTTFSFSELQEVAGRQLVLSKLNNSNSHLPLSQPNHSHYQPPHALSESPPSHLLPNSVNTSCKQHPRVGELPSDWSTNGAGGSTSQRITSSHIPLRTPHGNDSCMSVVPPNSCMSTLGAPVARVQITPPAAPQSPGRSIVVTQSVTLAQKQTPGSIFTVSAGQLPLSNLPTGIAKSKIHLQSTDKPLQLSSSAASIPSFPRKAPVNNSNPSSSPGMPRAIIHSPHSSSLGGHQQTLVRNNLDPLASTRQVQSQVMPKAGASAGSNSGIQQPSSICYMSADQHSKNHIHHQLGQDHVMPLGNGSRVRTSSGATVMGSNLRLNKFPLANVNDSSSHAGQVATQPQGQHLVNITTIYGDLGQSQNASGSSNSSVNNAAMITSNVNHISSPSCSVSPQTFTAYSTQQPSSRKVSGTHTHENKFKLVAVPNLHAHANMQGQGSSTAGVASSNALLASSGNKDYKTFSEQVSSREQIAQVYIAANSSCAAAAAPKAASPSPQSNQVPCFSHALPHHYNQ